jgi:hypothetical protein
MEKQAPGSPGKSDLTKCKLTAQNGADTARDKSQDGQRNQLCFSPTQPISFECLLQEPTTSEW